MVLLLLYRKLKRAYWLRLSEAGGLAGHDEDLVGGDRLDDLCFEGVGCAVSQASASLMTERLKGLSRDEATAMIVRGFLKVEIEGLPPVLEAELKKAIADSEDDLF